MSIQERRSIRKYKDQAVEFDKIAEVIDAARHAPTAGDLQEVRFIVTTDKNKIAEVADNSFEQFWINTAPVLIVACSETERQKREYGIRGELLYSIQDCAAAVQNLLNEATNQGLGTCWIGAFLEEKIRDIFEIPAGVRPQALITLGYSAEKPKKSDKLELTDIFYFDTYGSKIKDLAKWMGWYSVKVQEAVKQGKNLIKKS